MQLLIIEGPGKIKKISSILGDDWRVLATSGHIEKLTNSDYDNTGISKNFDLDFEFIDSKKKIMDEINEYANKSEVIYIATDPDREGEGIAWHIFKNLNQKEKAKRITFNEISEKAIKSAIASPRELDINYVNAYFARLILDKKIGYGLSRFLQKQVDLKSAGRVQSPGLKLVYENFKIRENFNSISFYKIKPKISNVDFEHISSKEVNLVDEEFKFNSIDSAKEFITNNLIENNFVCQEIKITNKFVSQTKPFDTSDVLQALSKELKIKIDEAQSILQKLYEKGYITYPRTDSTRYAIEFCQEGYEFVKNIYGDFSSNEFSFNKSSSGNQDAHEAIRVLHLSFTPEMMEDEIEEGIVKLAYEIIYKNTIIQFFKKQKLQINEVIVVNNEELFSYKFNTELEKGFNEYLGKEYKNTTNFEVEKIYLADNFSDMPNLIKTKPPSLYTQASLVNKLKILGIGRPSTFASIIKLNLDREYLITDVKDKLIISPSGILAIETIEKSFNSYIQYDFTDQMETSLDEIKNGKIDFKLYLKERIESFEMELENNLPKNKKFGTCPTCNEDTYQINTKTGSLIEVCSKRVYDSATKIISGCLFIKFPEKLPNFINRKCPLDNARLMTIKNPKGKDFIKCENGKYDKQSKKSSGCKYVEFQK